ncbi:MAG: DUF4197 domain-containing protein [Pseudomonadota bacterium]
MSAAMRSASGKIASALALAAMLPMAFPVSAIAAPHMTMAYQGFSLKGALADASDSALDKLAQPDAFYNDKDVRVRLPGPLRNAGKILRFVGKSGLANDLTRSLNDAAGMAAEEAKPVFRAAIDDLSLSDGVGIVTGGDMAGTEYLRSTSGEVLREKVRPLVVDALTEVGAFQQLDRLQDVRQIAALAGADISNDGLADSVTDQAMDGIFSYIGQEEAAFRANPLEKGKGLLDGIFGG